MIIEQTSLPGVKLLTPKRWGDERGYFVEAFNQATLRSHGIALSPVQENQSFSRTVGTVRGLHCQIPPYAQAKLVRVLRGRILDVAVDLRAGSPTLHQWIAVQLGADDGRQIFIPGGFAHGFCTLEPDTEIAYLVDLPYSPECERSIHWNDPDLKIAWPDFAGAVVSDKDQLAPTLAAIALPFP